MYFISNDEVPAEKPELFPTLDDVPKSKSPLSTNDVNPRTNSILIENNSVGKRVYGRARANLCFSSFYIFCEDFRKQLEYLYADQTESYRKNALKYMWKHLNVKDKHKYYETATKARKTYNLPEHLYPKENDQQDSTIKSIPSNSTELHSSNNSKIIGKLVKVNFSKTCITITSLKEQDVYDHLESAHGLQQDEADGFGEEKLGQDYGEISEHQDHGAEQRRLPLDHRDDQGVEERQWLNDGERTVVSPGIFYPKTRPSPVPTDVSTITITSDQQGQRAGVEGSTFSAEHDGCSGGGSGAGCSPAAEAMLQQYQQQPDYTPYGGIGYGAQPNAGYFNYAATESAWYGSPTSGGDHAQMHAGLTHNTHIGDTAGNFLNHGYHQNTSTGVATSSAESFAANNHPVSQTNMDPMADFLGGHQNMSENDKIIKEESIDWLSTIINDEVVVDHGNQQDGGDGGGGGGGGGGGAGNGKLSTGDIPVCVKGGGGGQESNGRLPNFHQAFGSTEIGRFSQHEYYEPPKDAPIGGECQSGGQPGAVSASGGNRAAQQQHHHQHQHQHHQQEEQPPAAAYEPPRQQNRRGRTQRGGGQHRRNKQTRAAAAAAAAAVAAQQYVGYDVNGSVTGGGVGGGGGGRHQVPPPYHHPDPYGRNQHAQQQRYHHGQDQYHHHHQQPAPAYQNHQQQDYYRPYDRMHHYQQPAQPPSQYYSNNREQPYAGGYNRFHSCCSTEHIARPNHHHNSYGGGGGGGGGQGQYYGDYNAYNQW